MPLIIPKELPAYTALGQENVFVMHQQRAKSQQIRPLRILVLNLMPTKITTETQLARLLANSPFRWNSHCCTPSVMRRPMWQESICRRFIKPLMR